LPKEEQGAMIGKITEWLKDDGYLLFNFITEEGDHRQEDWFRPGITMYSSGLGVEGNSEMVNLCGPSLIVVEDEVVGQKVGRNEATFHWIMGVKKTRERMK
jgi:hypothetical protein